MSNDYWKDMGLLTDEEINSIYSRLKKMEEDGILDTQKYFDRIHDKLFNLNNILIGAYFALIAIQKDITPWIFVIPLCNTLILLNIDLRMMKRARIQSIITKAKPSERNKFGSLQRNTNFYSLVSICSTLTILILFGYLLLFN